MLIELGLRGRIELEKQGVRRRGLLTRKIVCSNPTPTGDILLDEVLKHIKETTPTDTVQSWVELLSGRGGFFLSFSGFFIPPVPSHSPSFVYHATLVLFPFYQSLLSHILKCQVTNFAFMCWVKGFFNYFRQLIVLLAPPFFLFKVTFLSLIQEKHGTHLTFATRCEMCVKGWPRTSWRKESSPQRSRTLSCST